MKPVPDPEHVAATLAARAPWRANAWHPWAWTARTTGREALKLH